MLRMKRGPGRPQKFGRPSRAVTVTLPEDVIARLGSIDVDLGRAIVSIVERRRSAPASKSAQPAELTSYGNHSVIVVPPFNALKQIDGVELVPIGANRALISLDGPHRIPRLELAVRDALDRGAFSQAERPTLEALARILRQARLSNDVALKERTIIVLLSKPQRRPQKR